VCSAVLFGVAERGHIKLERRDVNEEEGKQKMGMGKDRTLYPLRSARSLGEIIREGF